MLAKFAHVALQKLHITPRQFYDMDSQEQAFTIASLLVQSEDEREQERKLKSKSRKK